MNMLVSVWITTYNHERYIAQALESVLMQETSFDVEIVIGDDCSTDSTREIINCFAEANPGKFRPFYPASNLGMIEMFKASYAECSGEFIAWLDGDDFWTNKLKLQKQVDFLQSNPDFILCFHDVLIKDELVNKEYLDVGPKKANDGDIFTIDHFLKGFNPVPAASVVHRNAFGKHLPDWLYMLPYPDFAFYFLALQKGKIKKIADVMAVYRIHKKGSYRGNSAYFNYQNLVKFFQLIKNQIPKRYGYTVNQILSRYYFDLFKMDWEGRSFKKAANTMLTAMKYDIRILYFKKRDLFKLLKGIPSLISK